MEEKKVFKQNLEEKGDYQRIYPMHLLFREKPVRPEAGAIAEKLEEFIGPVDVVSHTGDILTAFAARDYPVTYKGNQKAPAQVLMGKITPFKQEMADQLARTQQWDCPESEAVLNSSTYELMISDFMAAGLPYRERCSLLLGWVKAAATAFPDCIGVWFPLAQKLLTREQVLHNPYREQEGFLYIGMNIRFFNIQDTEDMLVDTLGLYAIGLPDIQYHFKGLEPDYVVRHALNVAAYIFSGSIPENGETISGLNQGEMDPAIKWKCQFEDALIQPIRVVMDICPGQYAAGNRQ